MVFDSRRHSQSNIGIKGKEAITSGLDFVFDLNFGFNPYSLTAANGPKSFLDNNGVPLASQSSNADSSRAGQFYNGVGYAGFSSAYGTLTFGRQNSLELDGVIAYDPMGASYGFSVIGWQGTAVGGGDTEDARISTAVKYRVDVGDWFRVGAIYQVGGYENNNGAQSVWGAQIGKDFNLGAYGKFSFDAIYTEDKGAVAASALSAAQNLLTPGTIAATISDNNSVMLLAKYTYQKLRVYGGYEYITFANPSSPVTTGFTGIAGIPFAFANITQTAFPNNEHLQIMWTGARYAITSTLDAGVAYYHYDQNSFGKAFCNTAVAVDLLRSAECGFVQRRLAVRQEVRPLRRLHVFGCREWSGERLPVQEQLCSHGWSSFPVLTAECAPATRVAECGTRIKEAAPRAASFVYDAA